MKRYRVTIIIDVRANSEKEARYSALEKAGRHVFDSVMIEERTKRGIVHDHIAMFKKFYEKQGECKHYCHYSFEGQIRFSEKHCPTCPVKI